MRHNIPESPYLTVTQFAREIHHSHRTVRRWIAADQLPALRITIGGSGRLLIPREEATKFLQDPEKVRGSAVKKEAPAMQPDQIAKAGTSPGVQKLLSFFSYDHLPPHLREVSKPFCELAQTIAEIMPSNAEATVALRKLLESKDCAVRAVLSP